MSLAPIEWHGDINQVLRSAVDMSRQHREFYQFTWLSNGNASYQISDIPILAFVSRLEILLPRAGSNYSYKLSTPNFH